MTYKGGYINVKFLDNDEVIDEWYIGDTSEGVEWPVEFDIQLNGTTTGKRVALGNYEEVDEYCMKLMDWLTGMPVSLSA